MAGNTKQPKKTLNIVDWMHFICACMDAITLPIAGTVFAIINTLVTNTAWDWVANNFLANLAMYLFPYFLLLDDSKNFQF